MQYVCANSRDALLEQGVWFPFSVEDAKMKLGLISAGNGDELAQALGSGDRAKLQQLMSSWVKEASAKNCTRILISTEAIVHHFTQQEKLRLLEETAEASRVQKISALGFFRDLLSHALSTYKHRASSGSYPDYAVWLAKHYETPTVLTQFLNTHSSSTIDWHFRKFKKDSNHLLTAFLADWLQVTLEKLPTGRRVNESLTLSEISFISELAQSNNKQLATTLSKHWRNLPGQQKAPDGELREVFLFQAATELTRCNELLTSLNSHLPQAEQLSEIQLPEGKPLSNNKVWSDRQLQVLTQVTTQYIGWRGLKRQLYNQLVRLIPAALRRKIIQYRYSNQAEESINGRD